MQSAWAYFLTHVFSVTFSFVIIADDQDATLVQFFKDLPIIAEQATHNIHSSNESLFEYFHRKHKDSLNVVYIFLSRCEELVTVSSNLTINIRRLPYKHTTCIPCWNDVKTRVSTSFQRGIYVVCLKKRRFSFYLHSLNKITWIS